MKFEDCKIGLDVYVLGNKSYKGKIKTLPDINGKVVVEFPNSGDKYCHYDLSPVDCAADKKLSIKAQAKINQAKSFFEKAFEAMQELHALVDNNSSLRDLQEEGVISLKELEQVVEKFGWSTSSLYC